MRKENVYTFLISILKQLWSEKNINASKNKGFSISKITVIIHFTDVSKWNLVLFLVHSNYKYQNVSWFLHIYNIWHCMYVYNNTQLIFKCWGTNLRAIFEYITNYNCLDPAVCMEHHHSTIHQPNKMTVIKVTLVQDFQISNRLLERGKIYRNHNSACWEWIYKLNKVNNYLWIWNLANEGIQNVWS